MLDAGLSEPAASIRHPASLKLEPPTWRLAPDTSHLSPERKGAFCCLFSRLIVHPVQSVWMSVAPRSPVEWSLQTLAKYWFGVSFLPAQAAEETSFSKTLSCSLTT